MIFSSVGLYRKFSVRVMVGAVFPSSGMSTTSLNQHHFCLGGNQILLRVLHE